MPEHYLINRPSDYPPLFRYLLALIPKESLEKYQWIVSPFFDFIHNLFLFFVVYFFTHNICVAVFSQIVYMLSPIVVMENSNLTTRSFASLLFSLSFFSLISYTTFGNFFFLIVSVILICILLLSHRMSIQALFFVVLVFSLYERTFIYVIVFISSILLALITSGGFYLKILKGHMAMIKFWFIHIDNRYAHQIRGHIRKKEKNPDAVFKIYQFVQKVPFMAVGAANPFILFVLTFLILRKFSGISFGTYGIPEVLFSKLFLWAVSLFVVGLVVRQVKKLGCIGEGERYLEYSAFPIAIITAVFLLNAINSQYAIVFMSIFLVVAVMGCLLPSLFIQEQVIVRDKKRSVTGELKEMFDYINNLEGKVHLITIPLYLADAATYFTHARLLTTDNSLAHITDYGDFFPVLKKPLEDIFKKYNISYLLINEEYVKLSELDLAEKNIVKKKEPYYLLKVNTVS